MSKLTIRVEETSPDFIVLQVLEQSPEFNLDHGVHHIRNDLEKVIYSVRIGYLAKINMVGKFMHLPDMYMNRRTFLKRSDARYLKGDFTYR